VHVHAPGPEPRIHVNVSMENWTMAGCASDTAEACRKTTQWSVPTEARVEFIRLWQEVRATPRCEPEARSPDDRAFEIVHSTGKAAGHLPAHEADLAKRNEGPCRADARLAMWFVHQWRTRR